MRKALNVASILLLSVAAALNGLAESTREFSVQVSATVQVQPPRITLNWPQDTSSQPTRYTIYRKAPGVDRWGKGTALPGSATNFTDFSVKSGVGYEYQIIKTTPQYTGYGYIYAGMDLPLTENRGKLLLVVDNTYAANLADELAQLQQDITGDGWTVTRLDINRDDSVAKVKSLIQAQYKADPANVKAVFLFGHVPVPYSGDIVPDGHVPDHQGAWPCDGYYGDMDGVWTDYSVNDVSATEARTRNVPGDGKFDQSTFPAPLKLMVGRVDLANLPGRLTWGGDPTLPPELQLLRNYLNKDHRFRTKQFDLPRRGVVGDYFGVRNGEAFAASGWRNFSSFFGASGIDYLPEKGSWIPTLSTNNYLWAYGCGAGSFTSIAGLGNSDTYNDGTTTELVQHDIKAVFTLLFGSWLGDWDSEDDILRSVLAMPTYSLTAAWSGRPHWFMHHMALGEPIGYSARLTQNNGAGGMYENQLNSCAGQIHIALMGDPTLRMHVVAPPANLTAATNNSAVTLRWAPAQDCVLGYHVYGSTNPAGPFTRLTPAPITNEMFVAASRASYMVRAVKLEKSASGTYFNLSQGAFLNPAPAVSQAPLVSTGTNAPVRAATNTSPAVVKNSLTPTGPLAWIDDDLPLGAIPGIDGNDSWTWVTAKPAPFSGTRAHQSNLAAGLHQHYFTGALNPLTVSTGNVLYAYVYLDTANPPTELMLQWNNGSWEHRAYWGADNINEYGIKGTTSRQFIGALPPAGQWARLEVPASQVALEGSTVNGMAFTLYGGRATWDFAGSSSPLIQTTNSNTTASSTDTLTNSVTSSPSNSFTANIATSLSNGVPTRLLVDTDGLPGISPIDYNGLTLPPVGSNTLHVLTPTLLELKLINTKQPDPARVAQWDFVNASGQLVPPSASAFAVTANNQSIAVTGVGFKRRPIYAPLASYDLRIENSLYLQLASPLADNQVVQVLNPNGNVWSSAMKFISTVDPLRYNPAIHVNQEGYMPNYTKKAMVGYFTGSLGEMNVPTSAGFKLIDINTGATVYQGNLTQRSDVGYTYSPTPYQQVYEADFTSFNTPGEYRLVVPGMGASLPFLIDPGIGMNFARAYALGLYHQRCGTNTALPYTRFTHDICHAAPASVPLPQSSYSFTWTTVAGYANTLNANNPPQIAPALTSPSAQLFPYVRQGSFDVSGGHHDAGDYSKYTINSASLVHYLMFSVDSLAGVAALDNLGIPESGDGISDVLQEAKWEADFLAKMQDSDGGFYFLVYPQNREYENNVTPDHGDPQVVWPKTTSVTAASVAALAQCASSPLFKRTYPAAAASYLQKAQLGWQFLTNAIARYGKNGAYQKITHYGDNFADNDEMAWAACQIFLATGDAAAHQFLLSWFDPSDPATWRWGWWRMSECYGHTIRSYGFAAQSGRVGSTNQLNATFLSKCLTQIQAAGDDAMTWSQQSAYGTSFPSATKAVQGGGWYFSCDQAFDITVAYQLNPKPDYLNALLANMNYEGGCNPINLAYITGVGWKRQRDIVSQWALNDTRSLPPSGIPVGNLTSSFGYLSLYQGELENLCFPSDTASSAPYPYYDRWGDSWNVAGEMVVLNQARGLGTLAFLAAQTSSSTQAWKSLQGQIVAPTSIAPVGVPLTLSFQTPPGMDLNGARVTWEARDQEPAFGNSFTFAPKNNGTQWVEAEAQWPDGRRLFAATNFVANSPNIIWVDDAVPNGAALGSDGGDSWNWVGSNPSPFSGSLANQSVLAAGSHQHFFYNATATLTIGTGDVLYAYVYLDPNNPPSEIMLQWNDGSWEHRAYWGANLLSYGLAGTPSRYYVGALPPAGQWVQLKVPASAVNLEGSTLNGMAFTLYNGTATWDAAGRLSSVQSAGMITVTTATNASRLTATPGAFTFSRSGDTSSSISVSYLVSGTATNGSDYQLNPVNSPVVIPAGAASVNLSVVPLSSSNFAGPQTVVVTLATNSVYTIGSASASMNLGGNTVAVNSIKFTEIGAELQWNSQTGHTYRVGFKDNLSDPVWTVANTFVATGPVSAWADVTPPPRQRFYIVAQIN